jgi:ferritin-like protein
MSYRLNVDDVDVDGALRETAEAVSGDTRLDFLKKTGIAGGALMSGGAILSAFAPSAFAGQSDLSGYGSSHHHHYQGRPPKSFGPGDIGILNFALTLEYLEAAFYNGAGAAGLTLSQQAAGFLKVVTKDENAHVAFLKEALGSKAVAEPKFDFKGTNTDPEMFLKTSYVLENTGVHAYLGQVANIVSPKYLTAAGTIVTIEGRHAGAVGLLLEPNGEMIAPEGPFDVPLPARTILTDVEETGFIVSS